VQALRAQEAAAGKPVTRPNRPRLIIITPTEGALLAQHRKLLLYKMEHEVAHKRGGAQSGVVGLWFRVEP